MQMFMNIVPALGDVGTFVCRISGGKRSPDRNPEQTG